MILDVVVECNNEAIVQMIYYPPYLLLAKYHHHCFSSFPFM